MAKKHHDVREVFQLPDGFFDNLDQVWGEIRPELLPPGLWREIARCRTVNQVFAVLGEYQETRTDTIRVPSKSFFVSGPMARRLGSPLRRVAPKRNA